ncbi:MAG: hypothetical protein ABJN42_00595 [Roseibium sp.]|uniref:hypothetical protein n=1 Tax=Roseibium sp. TaxID=1936156 RepID=UPI0032992523
MTNNVDRRCKITGETPSLGMLASIVSLRSMTVSQSTTKTEMAGLRSVLRDMLDGKFDPDIGELEWVQNADTDDIQEGLNGILQTAKEIKEAADMYAQDLIEAASGRSDLTDEELIEAVAGVGHQRQTVKNKGAISIGWREFLAYELNLSEYDPEETFEDMVAGKNDIRGLTRIFVTAMYLTGMRPVEIWSCRLMIPNPDVTFDNEMRKQAYENPTQSILDGHYIILETAADIMGRKIGTAARLAMENKQAPSIFIIMSAKQTNANEASTAYRMQVIDKISPRDLSVLSWATQFRRIQMDEKKRDSLRAAMTRTVKVIAKEEPAIKRENVNLYSFRHSFVDRVRREFFLHEAAALSGHTSPSSLYAYGENRTRKGSRSLSSDRRSWLPKPDPIQAEVIKSHWENPELAQKMKEIDAPDL